jgi:hypothetical protein
VQQGSRQYTSHSAWFLYTLDKGRHVVAPPCVWISQCHCTFFVAGATHLAAFTNITYSGSHVTLILSYSVANMLQAVVCDVSNTPSP